MGGEEKNKFNFVFVNEGSIFLALSENFENANFLKTFVLIKYSRQWNLEVPLALFAFDLRETRTQFSTLRCQ